MSKFLKIASIATLVAVVGVVAVGAFAFAQEPPEKPPFPRGMPFHGRFGGGRGHAPFGPMAGRFEGAGMYRDQMKAAMAEALDLSDEEFEAAIAEGQTLSQIAEAQGVEMADVRAVMVDAGQEFLDQAVADGLLTQEQADRFREHIAGHGPGRHGRVPFGGFEQFGAYREQLGEAFATALGMDVEDLKVAIADGQTPCEIVEAQDKDPDEVWEATESARQNLLQQAVDDELLTQEQADRIGDRLADLNPGDWCGEGGFGPGMRGMKRGFHGLRVLPGAPNQ